jgi:hydroxymethylglutaryl-CoA lyase
MAKEKIRIVEVGPRDGLQNESKIISTSDKEKFIRLLLAAGIKEIEVTSFVRADKIPQMADAKNLSLALKDLIGKLNPALYALVPNEKGLELASLSNFHHLALFTAVSETFNKKNINSTIDESLVHLKNVANLSKKIISKAPRLRGYISCVFGCPYEGETRVEKLKYVAEALFAMGCFEISLGDTIGVAVPETTYKVIEALKKHFDLDNFAFHYHDTRGLALANVHEAIKLGAKSFDSSAGGLGGCPYAEGASGNLATEDLVYFLHRQGYETGVDFKKLILASEFILEKLSKSSPSKVHQVYQNTKNKDTPWNQY